MKTRYNDGWLEVDFNEYGSNYERAVKCSSKVYKEIKYGVDMRMASELHELIECILDHIPQLDYLKDD